jgi:hypothetical protein
VNDCHRRALPPPPAPAGQNRAAPAARQTVS